jgi:hypothetical protein
MASETSSPAPPGKLLKLTLYLRKNKSLTEEQFHEHWRTKHAGFAVAAIANAGVVKYSQYHTSSATRALLKPKAQDGERQNFTPKLLDFDAIVQLWLPDMETYYRLGADPVFEEKIFADERVLFDFEETMTTLGWEEDMVVDGKIVMPGYEEGMRYR